MKEIIQIVVIKRADGLYKITGHDEGVVVFCYDGINLVELNSYFGILSQKLVPAT